MSSVPNAKIPTIVLGGTGYVAGELLRLIAGHPNFELAAIMSDSQPGAAVGQAFPHLAAVYGDTTFKSQDEIERLIAELPQSAVFGAAPKIADCGSSATSRSTSSCDLNFVVA